MTAPEEKPSAELCAEDWTRTIEQFTAGTDAPSLERAELDNATISAKTLLQRAAAYKALDRYNDALADIKTALTIDKNDPEAIQAMRDLLSVTAEKASSTERSINNLLLQATSDRTENDEPKKSSRQAYEAAQRLVVMSKDADVCGRLFMEGGIGLLIPAFLKDRELRGEQEAPSLQAALLRIIGNVATNADSAVAILSYITEENVDSFLGKKEGMSLQLATDILASVVLNAGNQLSVPNLTASAHSILQTFTRRLDPSWSEAIRVASLGGVIKAIATADLAMFLVQSSENAALFGLVDDKSEKIRALIPAALARIFEQIGEQQERSVRDACYGIVRAWVDSTDTSKKVKGYLALAAVFQARGPFGSSILLKEGFLDSIMECAESESAEVQLALIEILSSACTEKECRVAISQQCSGFLQFMTKHRDAKIRSAASVTITKLVSANKDLAKAFDLNASTTTNSFIITINSANVDAASKLRAVEGLAYLSMQPSVKEKLAYDISFLKTLLSFVNSDDRTLQFGVATIICNLTSYKRKLTQEEEQVRKLREMARDIATEKPDPLDDDGPVAKRAVMLAQAGAISAMVHLSKSDSPRIRDTISQVFLNFATDKRLHKVIVQQGGAKALLNLTGNGTAEGITAAAQALAKVAITVDPNLAFKGQRAAEIVRPLVALCNEENQLRQFEALMALTNLGSMNDEVRSRIVHASGVEAMENLQFSDNELIRRAATEALCNMMFDPQVFNSYAHSGKSHRFRMFVALADCDDFPTRRAAAGALAILSSSENACRLIMEESRGIEVVMGLVNEEETSAELHHRGIECLKNIARANADYARRLEAAGAIKALKRLLLTEHEAVAHAAAEALENFHGQGVSISI